LGKHKYRLKFIPAALDEWQKLDGSIKEPLRKALKKRLLATYPIRTIIHITKKM
jgi:mRNA-degrading endonuclease RelE of RelBE toxin-antitoxin system